MKCVGFLLSASLMLCFCSHGNAQTRRVYLSNNHVEQLRFTPTTPRPEDVNCYVDVPTTVRVGGRCVPFGRGIYSIWTCQSGPHLQFTQDCSPQSRHNFVTPRPAK